MLMPPPQAPPAAVAPPAQHPTYESAELALLASLDVDAALPAAPNLPRGAKAYAWLRKAAEWKADAPPPKDPFAKGSRDSKEAEGMIAFLASGKGLSRVKLDLAGNRLLLWKWMRHRDRHNPLPKPERETVEDRLLEEGPAVIQGWALRHALCFAIADKDDARFAALKAKKGSEFPGLFGGAQNLLGLLGGPSPLFRVWSLPGLRYRDITLSMLGSKQVWICPPGLPVPPGAAWIIPSDTGEQSARETDLNPGMKLEADGLVKNLHGDLHGKAAWFAASRSEWEAAGLSWFPILITLDAQENIASVQMGDAAP